MSRSINQTKTKLTSEFQQLNNTLYKMLITRNSNIIYTFLLKEDRIYKVSREQTDTLPIGTILIGKVMNVLPQMNGCFVKLGCSYDHKDIIGYLPIISGTNNYTPLNRKEDGRILAGDELVVTITKEALKTKQCQLMSGFELSSEYAVFQRGTGTVLFSRKLNRNSKLKLKAEIKQWKESLTTDELMIFEKFNLTIRTNAQNSDVNSLLKDVTDLFSQCKKVDQLSQSRAVFSIIKETKPDYINQIQNLPNEMVEEIITDQLDIFESFSSYPMMSHFRYRLYQDTAISLSKIYSLDTKIKELLSAKAYMKSGAYLVIEQTEALISIDVNTGKNIKKSDSETFFLNTNMEAAAEVFYQLSARNLSGMILVDFINMKSEEHKEKLIDFLITESKKDPVTTMFVDFTKLGLAEITRKKISNPLHVVLSNWSFN